MIHDIENLYETILESDKVLVFTGAGISTLSGIPDFRGVKGVYREKWHGMEVEEILSIPCFLKHPEYFYEWAQTFVYGLKNYRPNIVHQVIADWEKRNIIYRTYTQNIDILHQHAGSKRLYELHGSPAVHYCLRCGKTAGYQEIAPIVMAGETPHCSCGGVFKPDIIFYGENLHEEVLTFAEDFMTRCDVLLALGSSLTVYPAAGLPRIACRHGAKLVIVNDQPTDFDRFAHMRFTDLGEVFTAMEAHLQ